MTAFGLLFFHDEQAAYGFVESLLQANGRVCPKCGVVGESRNPAGVILPQQI